MVIPQRRPTIDDGHGFKQAVTVGKTAIPHPDTRFHAPIDQGAGIAASQGQAYPSNLVSSREPLVPPNPKELESA